MRNPGIGLQVDIAERCENELILGMVLRRRLGSPVLADIFSLICATIARQCYLSGLPVDRYRCVRVDVRGVSKIEYATYRLV